MKKRLLALLCLLALCLHALPAGALWTEASPYDLANIANPRASDRLHLRKAPRSTALSLGKYYNGVRAEVLEYTNSTWTKVRIGGTVGYMQTAYLTFGTDNGIVSAIPSATVLSDRPENRLNLREGRSQSSASLGKYPAGTVVQVLGYGTTWHHVLVDGKVGYMMAKYLRVDGDKGGGSGGSSGSSTSTVAVVNNPNMLDRLHLRTAARTNAASLGKYFNGTRVTVLEQLASGWCKVQIGNLQGYMMTKYLAFGAAAERVESTMVWYVSTSSSWDLYKSPSYRAEYSIYGLDESVYVMGFTADWMHVLVPRTDAVGFVPNFLGIE